MPLIKIDYDQSIFEAETSDALVELLLKESMRIYDYDEDKVSIFSSPYGDHHFSTAAAEIEVRAKATEYDKPDVTPAELRTRHISEYERVLTEFISQHKLPKGMVFTITFEDWQVLW